MFFNETVQIVKCIHVSQTIRAASFISAVRILIRIGLISQIPTVYVI